MARRRLGCLSGASFLAVALTLLVVLGVSAVRGGRWFSPGPLNAQAGEEALGSVRSHAETGGQCRACHTAPWDPATMSERCLDCHTAVAGQFSDPSTLHGALLGAQPVLDCRDCHPEHQGAAASLTQHDMSSFPHAAVGFSLAVHALRSDGSSFSCIDCHSETVARFNPTTCESCHREVDTVTMQQHVADFGAACLDCHDGVDRYGAFDHGRLAFPLTGKHAALACSSCHVDARNAADLQATPGNCVACHQDPAFHQGAFGTDCADCHTAEAWQPAQLTRLHSFPIDHGEAGVSPCRTCHTVQVQDYTCYTCHEHDEAGIAEEHLEEGIRDFADCTACHPTGQKDEAEDRGGGGEDD